MTEDVERWRQIIHDAQDRRQARDALGCTFRELKAFRAGHMPGHSFPDSRTPDERQQQAYERRVKRRALKSGESQ